MEKHFLKRILRATIAALAIFSLPLLSSCARTDLNPDSTPAVEESVTTGSVVKKADGEYTGTGTIRFLRTLSSSQISTALELGANLDSPDSSVDYVILASRPTLTDGVHLHFFRTADNRIQGSMNINNTGVRSILDSRIESFGTIPLRMAIDIHAFGDHARAMIYAPEAPTRAPYFFDSQRAGDLNNGLLAPSSLAEGLHSGIILNNARVFKAIRRDPVTSREQAL